MLSKIKPRKSIQISHFFKINQLYLVCFIPFSNVLGEIALLAVVVEDLSGIAALFNWGHSFQADVILLAVCGVGIFGVGVFDELGG
jgi:hypothetical protein